MTLTNNYLGALESIILDTCVPKACIYSSSHTPDCEWEVQFFLLWLENNTENVDP